MAADLVRALSSRGFAVLTTGDAGMTGQSDDSQLEFATRDGRAIVTANRADFARLHARVVRAGGHHGGIVILLPQGQDVGFVVERLTAIVDQRGEDGLRDFLAFI